MTGAVTPGTHTRASTQADFSPPHRWQADLPPHELPRQADLLRDGDLEPDAADDCRAEGVEGGW